MEDWLRWVKVFVVVAGVLIILGTGTLVALLVARGTGRPSIALDSPQPVALPAGLRLVAATPAGDRILLELRDQAGRPHLLLVDAASGEPLGYLVLPATAAADADG